MIICQKSEERPRIFGIFGEYDFPFQTQPKWYTEASEEADFVRYIYIYIQTIVSSVTFHVDDKPTYNL